MSAALSPVLNKLAVPGAAADVALGDWSELFDAVKIRLAETASECAAGEGAGADERLLRMKAGVLDCVTALDQLHQTVARELERYRRLEQDGRA